MTDLDTDLRQALAEIPNALVDELIACFGAVIDNFHQGRWESSELNAGKFAEVVYSILNGVATGTFPARAVKPPNMVRACHDLEQAPKTVPRSVKVHIPRMLVALYEFRNNRGVGHVKDAVDANQLDATVVLQMSKWVLAELVRLFDASDPNRAAAIVTSLMERDVPAVWEVEGKRRVLNPNLTRRDEMLTLLYGQIGAVDEDSLLEWIGVFNRAAFRRDVLRPAHEDRLVRFDEAAATIVISPRGAALVEAAGLLDGTTSPSRGRPRPRKPRPHRSGTPRSQRI